MTHDDLASRIQRIAAANPGFRHRVLFDLGSGDSILLDATSAPPTAVASPGTQPGAPAPDATIAVSTKDLEALVDGSLSPTIAYMTGRLKVAGPLDVAMKLGRMLGEE